MISTLTYQYFSVKFSPETSIYGKRQKSQNILAASEQRKSQNIDKEKKREKWGLITCCGWLVSQPRQRERNWDQGRSRAPHLLSPSATPALFCVWQEAGALPFGSGLFLSTSSVASGPPPLEPQSIPGHTWRHISIGIIPSASTHYLVKY